MRHLPGDLPDLHSIDISRFDSSLLQTELIVLCDVKNKLLGTNGAAKIFGPQKGATNNDITALEKSMKRLNKVVHQTSGIRISSLPHGGAAGGVAASLAVLCDAKIVNGIDFFLDAIQFNQLLQQAYLVITGEGALDAQTLEGKAPFGVAQRVKKPELK
ncbi:glycerate kinase [Niabella hibiscisoli]|nr:glycerate kinase [Niabella hibiscisoli]